MTAKRPQLAPRAAATLAAIVVAMGALLALAPVRSGVRAVDPSPDPSAAVSPDPGPTPTPVDPTPAPTPEPTATPDPTEAPSPTATADPDPTADPGLPTPDPGASADPNPSVDPGASADPGAAGSPTPSSSPALGPTPSPPPDGLVVDHAWIDTLDAHGTTVRTGPLDSGLAAMERFVVYRVRFRVTNPGDDAVELRPRLETADGSTPSAWSPVPAVDPVPGSPFYAASDRGRTFDARTAGIPAAELRLAAGPADGDTAAAGMISSGLNPMPAVTLPGHAFTELAFDVRATIDAAWTHGYAFRLAGTPSVAEAQPVRVTMRSRPPIVLTLPAGSSPASTGRLGASALTGDVLAAASTATGVSYQLAAEATTTSPHLATSLTSDGCAACHAAHSASSGLLLSNVYRANPLRAATEPYQGADFALCLNCHSESPFADTSGSTNPDTAFPGHGYHLGLIELKGTGGLDIETGGGQGNALCAECHYQLHATEASGRGLVTFAPDVVAFNGEIRFDAATESCTLTCHGKDHDNLSALPSP